VNYSNKTNAGPYDEEGRLWTEVGGRPIEILAFTPPKFEVGSKEATQYLAEHGYVVFKNAATPEQLKEAEDIFWDSASKWYGVRKDKMDGWTDDKWTCVAATRTGVVSNDSSAHSPFMWYARGLPKIKQAFQSIWDDEQLLVSFDGYGLFRPPEIYGQTRAGWFHVDQNGYNKPGLHCVQGFLNVYPCGSEDGGLVVVPGSHIRFDKWFGNKRVPPKRSDFIMLATLPMQEEDWWGVGNLPIKLNLEPGDFAMWDSRTSHCSHPAKILLEAYPRRLRRLVAYVCMTPASKAANLKDLREKRKEAQLKGITLNHWPHEYNPHPTDHGNGGQFKYEPVELNEAQKKLLLGE